MSFVSRDELFQLQHVSHNRREVPTTRLRTERPSRCHRRWKHWAAASRASRVHHLLGLRARLCRDGASVELNDL